MRRKYNDLLAKRAGILTEAESLLKAGKREDYQSKMTEIENLNGEITDVKALIDEQDRRFLQKTETPGEAKDKALERAEILRKGGEVKFSAAEVRKAILARRAHRRGPRHPRRRRAPQRDHRPGQRGQPFRSGRVSGALCDL